MVCQGCILSGGHVRRSILSPNVRVNSYAVVDNSILFDGVDVARHCRIRRAIIDKEVKIPPQTHIGHDLEYDRRRGFTVTEQGVVVIAKAELPEAGRRVRHLSLAVPDLGDDKQNAALDRAINEFIHRITSIAGKSG